MDSVSIAMSCPNYNTFGFTLDNLNCARVENHVNNCSHADIGVENCGSRECIYLNCSNNNSSYNTNSVMTGDIRLIEGNSTAGLL